MVTLKTFCCTRCTYDLTGLAPVGQCPECGNPYDVDTGQGAASQAEFASERRRTRYRTFGLAAAVLASGCLLSAWLSTVGPLFFSAIPAALLVLARYHTQKLDQ